MISLPNDFSGLPGLVPSVTDPLAVGVVVAPNDGADLAFTPRAIHVGTAGNVKMNVSNGTGGVTAITTALEAGWHPIRPSRIFATGTTATDITAWR